MSIEYSKVSMFEELCALGALTNDQMSKIASQLSDEEAASSIKRLKKLEDSAPSPGKIMRGAMVGGVVGPMASLAWRAAAGPVGRMGKPINLGARTHLANAAHGAIFGGLMPAGQHKLETEVEKQNLREYLGTHPKGTLRGRIKQTVGL